MKTFKHMGKIGDIIFSLPTIRELGGGILYIPENTPDGCFGMYTALKDLLLLQPYINEVREYPSGLAYKEQAPGIAIDYDLDLARDQPLKGRIHIVKRYMDAFGVDYPGWREPWLISNNLDVFINPHDIEHVSGTYSVINYTSRHIKNEKMNITSCVDWYKIWKNHYGSGLFFIGLESEYNLFIDKFLFGNKLLLTFFSTKNIFELARVINHAQIVYCNQSSVLALAQSLGKTYYLEPKPHKTNCLLYTQNENILQ